MSEADRAARLKVIGEQGEKIADLESKIDFWLNESKRLQKENSEMKAERDGLRFELKSLREHLESVEADRAETIEEIHSLSVKFQEAQQTLEAIQESRIYRLFRTLGLEELMKTRRKIRRVLVSETRRKMMGQPFVSFRKRIDSFNNSQLNKDQLDRIRAFNHNMIDQLNDIFPLTGCLLLDVGASPHGYAMERALQHNITLYIGIGLDIAMQEYVFGERDNVGILLNMDAMSLKFPDAIFDVVFSISVFEHVSDVSSVLAEIYRVLKPGGCALISFEPVWSCSYGHHLHHFPSCSKLIPPWAHLTWPPGKMRKHLFDRWPKDAPLSLEEAVDWIYFGNSINRVNIREFQELIDKSPLKVSWKVDLREDKKSFDPLTIAQTSVETGLTPNELTTKGLSLLMSKGSMK